MIGSPKRRKARMTDWEGFSPYYAGYPEHFAQQLLASAGLDKRAVVFDPWNGSGTTTYVASKLGLNSIGVDINPVMVVVAKARMLPSAEADSLDPLAKQIVKQASTNRIPAGDTDPLLDWFTSDTSSSIRSIEQAIRENLVGGRTVSKDGTDFSNMSLIASALYVALFAATRELTAKFRSSNPTWFRRPKKQEQKADAPYDVVATAFCSYVASLATAISNRPVKRELDGAFSIDVADSTSRYASPESIDFVLTSPPYCTRIDYATTTAIQLAVLGPLIEINNRDLSRLMLGTTRVPPTIPGVGDAWGRTCQELLQKIEAHPSKASSTYYLKNHIDYFDKLYRSFSSISETMKCGATAVFVVQDSYYKDIHNDLQSIVSEMMGNLGLKLCARHDFHIKATLATTNPKSTTYRTSSSAIESVLQYKKN